MKFKVGDLVSYKGSISIYMVIDIDENELFHPYKIDKKCDQVPFTWCNEDDLRHVVPPTTIRQFNSGAVRDTDEGKPPMEYIPWDLMDRVAFHYGNGGAKYGYNNYRLGQPKKDVYASLMRHARKYFMGDTSEDHLSAIIWNAFSLMHTDVYYPNDEELNNLQDYKKKIREGK